MNEHIKEIAQRMKEMREILELSVEDISKALNVDPAKYESYENGETDIPMGFLLDFAKHCNLDLTDLLSGGAPMLSTYSYIKKGRGQSVERRKYYEYQHLAYNFANRKAEPFLVTVESNENNGIHLNSHDGQEFNYCVEGRLLISIGGNEIILEPGDSVYYNSLTPHGMKALDGKPARFLAVIIK
ncbi:MAG: helix-turn-helix transcriptional regulator [Clostridiaceae bacterium]|nr:helix-turn-helix transcriptional regulator [Clostridiaceae bacterium]